MLQPIGWIVQYIGYKKIMIKVIRLVLDIRKKVIKPNIKYYIGPGYFLDG